MHACQVYQLGPRLGRRARNRTLIERVVGLPPSTAPYDPGGDPTDPSVTPVTEPACAECSALASTAESGLSLPPAVPLLRLAWCARRPA